MVKERKILRKRGVKYYPHYPYENVLPDANNSRDLGSSSLQYHDAYVDGSGYFDAISISKNMIPEADSFSDLGATSKEFRNTWIDGTGNFDVVRIDDDLRVPATATYNRSSGLGTLFVKYGVRPYLHIYVSGVAAHVWASTAFHTGA